MSVNSAAIRGANTLWIRWRDCGPSPYSIDLKYDRKCGGIGRGNPQKQPNSLTPTAHLLCVSRFLTDARNGIGPDTPKNTEQS